MTLTEAAAERAAAGKQLRTQVKRADHAHWEPAADRDDPVAILSAQDSSRIPWLVPVRHARMAESPFAFYRGAAAIMAADLAHTPSTGLTTQLCGDAHLANFGSFASPERRQVFDVNDFDETLPGPWEWDVKRLAASLVLAARSNGFDAAIARKSARQAVAGYRTAIARCASASTMDVWYAQVGVDQLAQALPSKSDRKRLEAQAAKARKRTSERALGTLAETVDGQLRLRSQPPLLVPMRDLAAASGQQQDPDQLQHDIHDNFATYRDSLSEDRRHLLSRFRVVDMAVKVVGVGSVGTRCFIVLLTGIDDGEPLFLQVKEASDSVLEAHLAKSRYHHHGRRVVEGQRVMQASSDIMLGTSHTAGTLDFYWRQYHDMKASADIAALSPDRLGRYGEVCGATLAHAHARAGDAVAISAYLGSSDAFDRAVGEFAVAYARQSDADFAAFTDAIKAGTITTG